MCPLKIVFTKFYFRSFAHPSVDKVWMILDKNMLQKLRILRNIDRSSTLEGPVKRKSTTISLRLWGRHLGQYRSIFASTKNPQIMQNPLWLWNPEETSPEIQTRPYKHVSAKKVYVCGQALQITGSGPKSCFHLKFAKRGEMYDAFKYLIHSSFCFWFSVFKLLLLSFVSL